MCPDYKKTRPVICVVWLLLSSAAFAQTAELNTCARYLKKGSEQIRAGDYKAARDSFSEAVRYNEHDSGAHLGIGLACFYLKDDVCADRELSRSVELDPKLSAAYQWLGELFYRRDDLENAVMYWEKAVELDSSSKIKARLERIRRERLAEKDFNRDVTSHFLVKYEGREKIEAGKIILRILEDAYGEVGRELSFYPEGEIQVILYSAQQFQEVTDAPGWSGGVFDGKIRIPIGGIEKETPGLRRLLFHEYTHAAVRAITRRCPTWLNEGLAQYFEGKEIGGQQKEAITKLVQAGNLPSLSGLEGSFTTLNTNQAMLAYGLSLSSVRYLIDTFGLYRVRGILEALSTGAGTAKAISSALSLSYEEFENGWKRSIE